MKITMEIEVSEEDLRAGNWAFSPDRPDDRMSVEDMVDFHLAPAVKRKLRSLRSQMKWTEGRFWEHPKLRKDEGHALTTVTDAKGKRYDVMLPTGKLHPVSVVDPKEGVQDCPDSPTKFCWYNGDDPAYDFCLFCGEPHERK